MRLFGAMEIGWCVKTTCVSGSTMPFGSVIVVSEGAMVLIVRIVSRVGCLCCWKRGLLGTIGDEEMVLLKFDLSAEYFLSFFTSQEVFCVSGGLG